MSKELVNILTTMVEESVLTWFTSHQRETTIKLDTKGKLNTRDWNKWNTNAKKGRHVLTIGTHYRPPSLPHPPQISEYFPLQIIVRLTKYSISCNWKIQHFAQVHPQVQHSYTLSITNVTVIMHWCVCQSRQVNTQMFHHNHHHLSHINYIPHNIREIY